MKGDAMPFTKIAKPSHYVVELDESGAVSAVSLRTVESVIDSDTNAPVSDQTVIEPIVGLVGHGADVVQAKAGLVALRNLIDEAISAVDRRG